MLTRGLVGPMWWGTGSERGGTGLPTGLVTSQVSTTGESYGIQHMT